MSLGEFDTPDRVPFRNQSEYSSTMLAPALERLSEAAARQSLVLLHNPRHALPLFDRGSSEAGAAAAPKTVAVVGLEAKMDAGCKYSSPNPNNLTESSPNRTQSSLVHLT